MKKYTTPQAELTSFGTMTDVANDIIVSSKTATIILSRRKQINGWEDDVEDWEDEEEVEE